MKQTFNIPDGCKTASVEQVGNQIITSFEPEKYVPKVGDSVKVTYAGGNVYFFETSEVVGFEVISRGVIIAPEGIRFCEVESFSTYSSFEKLTPEEFQTEFEKLGYVYDFETHTASKKRWRAEKYGEYYLINPRTSILKFSDHYCEDDDLLYEIGNYFKTRNEAEVKANEIKKLLKQ